MAATRTFRRSVAAALAAALLMQMQTALVYAEPATTIQDVLSHWKRRQERIRSVRFEWNAQVTRSASLDTPMTRPGEPRPVPSPQASTTKQLRWTLVLDGGRIRHSSLGEKFDVLRPAPAYVNQPYTSVFDGTTQISHFDRGTGPGPNSDLSVGFIAVRGYSEKGNQYIEPIVLHYRALDPSLTHVPGLGLAVASEPAVVDGAECLVLAASLPDVPDNLPEAIVKYYVDPGRDFAIRRWTALYDGRLVARVDVSYQLDASGEWVPAGWDGFSLNATGGLSDGVRATVTSYALNLAVSPAEFQYVFPPDTLVRDDRDDTRYIVRKNGDKRMVTRGEERAAAGDFTSHYQRLVSTESGRAYLGPRQESSLPFLGLAAAAVALALIIIVLRRGRVHS